MIYRILVIGKSKAGKSQCTLQFLSNHFIEDYEPTADDTYRKTIEIDGEPIISEIHDVYGEEPWQMAMRAAHGYLIVYSVTSKESFNKVEEYRKKVYACQDIEEHESFSIVIIGNKCDLESEREVSTQEGQDYARKYGLPFFESSAKERTNIDESFYELIKLTHNRHRDRQKNNRRRVSTHKSTCTLL